MCVCVRLCIYAIAVAGGYEQKEREICIYKYRKTSKRMLYRVLNVWEKRERFIAMEMGAVNLKKL